MSNRMVVTLLGIVVLLSFGVVPGRHGVTGTLAQNQATPEIPGDGTGSLAAMLGIVPDILTAAAEMPTEEIDRAFPIVGYADIATQLNAFGAVAPTWTEPYGEDYDAWWRVAQGLAVVPDGKPSRFANRPEWRTTFGLDWFQVDQAMQIDWGPWTLLLLRGRFAADELRTAWAGSGYQTVTIDGVSVASYRADAEIDFASPVGQLGTGALNNAAILDDGTVVFTSTLAGMEEVLAVAAGQAPSLAANPDVAALLGSSPDLVSAFLFDGTALKRPTAEEPVAYGMDDYATAIADAGTMPQVELALIGVTEGGTLLPSPSDLDATPAVSAAPARFILALLMADRAEAEAAVPVVTDRLATMPSASLYPMTYAEFFVDPLVSVPSTTSILLVDLAFRDAVATRWIAFVNSYDLGFIAW